MGLSFLIYLCFLIQLSMEEEPLCTTDLGICMRPLVDTWEHIRNIENHAANLIFPLPLYRRNATLALCEQYDTIRRKCFINNCDQSPMSSFVKQQLGWHNKPAIVYLEKHDCTSSTLLRNRQCLRHLHGMPSPLVGSVRCNSFADFFDCAEPYLDKKCGHEAVILFGGAIRAFGCDLDAGVQLDEDLKFLNSSLAYTEEALAEFFEKHRPENLTELLTSVEVQLSTDFEQTEETTEASTTTKLREILMTTAEGSSITEEIEITTAENVSEDKKNELKRDESIISSDQELNDSSEAATTSIENSKSWTTAEAEIFEVMSTEMVDQPDLSSVTERSAVQEAIASTSEEVPIQSTTNDSTDETTINPGEDLSSTVATCSEEDEDYVQACHAHLLRRLANLSPKNPSLQIRFPLAGIVLQEVQHLCKMYDEANRCSSDQLPRCENMQMMRLINSQLEAVCFRIDSMARDYQCMLDTFKENPKCVDFLRGPQEAEQDACIGQQEAYDCFSSSLSCAQGALILAKEMVRGHGCRVDLKRWLIKPLSTTVRTTTGETTEDHAFEQNSTDETTFASKLHKKIEKEVKLEAFVKPLTSIMTSTLLPLLTTEALPQTEVVSTTTAALWFGTCSPENRKIARMCMGPLLRTWDGLRRRRLQLQKSRFPLYRYTKTELLELCDGYANSFLCAGHDTIRYCLNDELVSFAQGHLGYQCSPQNLQRFLKYYDCITEVEETSSCKEMMQGEALSSSRNRQICLDIADYTKCMMPLVETQCHGEGLIEFKRTVKQFGCKNIKTLKYF